MKKNIFFSYCWDDEKEVIPFIEELIKKIEYNDDNFFLDRRTNKLADQYWKNIRNAIETSQLFIFFNSNKYYNSSACCKEYVWALSKSKLNDNFKILEIKLNDSNLYRPYDDQIYVKFNNENILDEMYKAIYKNDFTGFNVQSVFYDLKTYDDNNYKLLIKFKAINNINNPIIAIFMETDQNYSDVITINGMGEIVPISTECGTTDAFPRTKYGTILKYQLVLNKDKEITIKYDKKYNLKSCIYILNRDKGNDYYNLENYDFIWSF